MGTLHEDQYTLLISRSIILRMRNVSDKSCGQNRNTHFMLNIFFFFFRKSCHLWICGKMLYSRAGVMWQHGTWAFHAGSLRLQTRSRDIQHFLLFHCNNGCTKEPHCYVILHCLPCWTFATNIHASNHRSNYISMRTNGPRRTIKILYLKCFNSLGINFESSTYFLAISGR